MHIKSSILLLSCIILFSFGQLLSKPVYTMQTNQDTSALFEHFTAQTGFKGDVTPAEDGRIFSKLNGTFNLPEPKDSIGLCHNTDIIANELNKIYINSGAEYIIKRVDYRRSTNTCQYIQFWGRYNLVHQPYYLLITYYTESNSYTLSNTLYMKPVYIPDKVITPHTARSLFRFIFDTDNLESDISKVPLKYMKADTDSITARYDHFTVLNLNLNLYPCNDRNSKTDFRLQWLYPNNYEAYIVPHGTYFIDAETGELRGDAVTYFRNKLPLVKAANECIKEMGFKGNCEVDIYEDYIIFHDIKIPQSFHDTTGFRLFIQKDVDAIITMYRKLGYNPTFKYSGARWIKDNTNNPNKFCDIIFTQKFRFQLAPDTYYIARISVLYNFNKNTLRFETNCYKKDIKYPAKVLSPETIFKAFMLCYGDDYPEVSLFNSVDDLPKEYIKTGNIPYANVYKDDEHHLTARLCMQPVYGKNDKTIELRLVWVVNDDINPARVNYFNVISGHGLWGDTPVEPTDIVTPELTKARQAEQNSFSQTFYPLGMLSDFEFLPCTSTITNFQGKFNLPAAIDSVSAMDRCGSIIRLLMLHYKLNPNDYTYTPVLYEKLPGFRLLFTMAYKGFEIKPPDALYKSESIEIIYYAQEDYYAVFLCMDYHAIKLPEFVITPESALDAVTKHNDFPMIWTGVSSLSGSKDYTMPELYRSEDETVTGEEFTGSIMLKFAQISVKNSAKGEMEYRLVWVVYPFDGAFYYIDAATGEILYEETWDVC